ncbi:hypothetical protein HRbin11_00762 [bacterium HR11]|nr:hypothetical protein HRbin11_00762 [bacterium HR11]
MTDSLDELMDIPGVQVAFVFTPDGQYTAYRTRQPVSPQLLATLAQYCATVTMTLHTLASNLTALTDHNWLPQDFWVYVGGDVGIVMTQGGFRGVLLDPRTTDWPRLWRTLGLRPG